MNRISGRRFAATTIVGLALSFVVASCGIGADPAAVGEPWEFGGVIPEAITVPLPSDGEVISSLTTAERMVVMVAYPGARLAELVAFYDDRLAGVDTIRSEHTIIAETEAVWMVRWRLTDLEVRVGECIDAFTREFSRVCVAVDQHPQLNGT